MITVSWNDIFAGISSISTLILALMTIITFVRVNVGSVVTKIASGVSSTYNSNKKEHDAKVINQFIRRVRGSGYKDSDLLTAFKSKSIHDLYFNGEQYPGIEIDDEELEDSPKPRRRGQSAKNLHGKRSHH